MIYRAIDLFAGIGGIRKGFEIAFKKSMDVPFVSEIDPSARRTYCANFTTPRPIAGDINDVILDEIPKFDICLAGFPCQAFSIAGKMLGFQDATRGTLFFKVAEICRIHKPSVIFCENVKGLTFHDGGRTYETILGTLDEIGYVPYSTVLNSKYYGVPQNRERMYIVAFNKEKVSNHSDFQFPDKHTVDTKLGDIVSEKPVSVKYYLSETYLETLRRHKERHKAAGHGFGYCIKDMDDLASTLVCGGMGRERNLIVDDRLTDFTPVTHIKGKVNSEYVRRLTPREFARLQGFPDSFNLKENDSQLYRQLGNTVSVPVVAAIASQIKLVLGNKV